MICVWASDWPSTAVLMTRQRSYSQCYLQGLREADPGSNLIICLRSQPADHLRHPKISQATISATHNKGLGHKVQFGRPTTDSGQLAWGKALTLAPPSKVENAQACWCNSAKRLSLRLLVRACCSLHSRSSRQDTCVV